MAFASPSPICRTSSALSQKAFSKMPTINDHEVTNHMLRSGPLVQSQAVFNKSRNTVYNRYTQNDWEASNKGYFNLSDKERSMAERLRMDAWQTIRTIDQQTKNRQATNTKKIGDRVADITFWKEELINEIRANAEEIEEMKNFMRTLDQYLNDTRHPLLISEECLMQREGRTGIDQVSDAVEKALSKEIDTIKKCQDRLKRVLEKAAMQQKMTKAAQLACEQDSRNKHHAQDVDGKVHQLHNSSSSIGLFPNIENYDNTITVPMTWMKFTQCNITRSQTEREHSAKLRGEMDLILRQCNSEMNSNNNVANSAFQTRIQEMTDAKNRLQNHFQRTVIEIKELERVIQLLKRSICDKEAPLKVAQTRLEERTKRIDVELCNDPSMQGLQREVEEIKESVRMLKAKLKESENALARLLKTRSALENDISTKERSIDIDNKACMGLRKTSTLGLKLFYS